MDLRGLKLVVDCAHGAAYHVAPKVFHELGAEVVAIGAAPDGLNINAGVGATAPKLLREQVVAQGADLGLALDGDADRLLMVDGAGRLYDGDELLYIVARHQQATRVATRLKHIGFSVGTLETSLAFYRDILGFTETWRGSSNGQQLSWVNLRVPDGEEYVELMLYAQAPTLAQLGPMNHMSLEVASVAAAREVLGARAAAAGYRLPMEPKTGINRKRQLNLFDPDGTRVELMEPGTIDGQPAPSSAAPAPVRSTPVPPE